MFDPEFDCTYRIDAAGTISDAPGNYLPTVEHDDTADVLIYGVPYRDLIGGHPELWQPLTGHTGQYGYRGAVMHPSERWGQWAVDALAWEAENVERPVLFAVVVVESPCGYCESGEPMEHHCERDNPVGWAVIWRAACESE